MVLRLIPRHGDFNELDYTEREQAANYFMKCLLPVRKEFGFDADLAEDLLALLERLIRASLRITYGDMSRLCRLSTRRSRNVASSAVGNGSDRHRRVSPA